MRTFVDAPQHFPEVTHQIRETTELPAFATRLVQPRTWLTSEPIPRIDTSTTEPSFIDPTLIEVPTADHVVLGINASCPRQEATAPQAKKQCPDNG